MTTSLYLSRLPFTLNVEAGYQNIHDDPGNWTGGAIGAGTLVGTNHGITPGIYALDQGIPVSSVTAAMMRAVTTDLATAIYARQFWNKIKADSMPPGPDGSSFDMEVNSGIGGAVSFQRAIGMPESQCDGWIGAQTLTALATADPFAIAKQLSGIPAEVMQRALNVKADGDVGPKTIDALTGIIGPGGSAIAVALAARLYDTQMTWYRTRGNWSRFSATWTTRCMSRLEWAVGIAAAWRAQPVEAVS